jgi:hypothetical protein
MQSFSRDLRDPDIDGPDDYLSASKGSKRHFKLCLLAAVTLISMGWGGSVVYRFLQNELVFTSTVSRTPDEDPIPQRPKRPEFEPLFAKTPLFVRNLGFPTSQVDFALVMRRIEARNEEELLRSHDRLDVDPIGVRRSVSQAIRPYVSPGLKIDGWLMRVNWSTLRDQRDYSKFTKYTYDGGPPVYEVPLLFPDELAGFTVRLWGWNFDFRSKEYTCPNRKFESIEGGDWVRVFGVLWPESRVEWERMKSDEFLCLGEMMISDIQKVTTMTQ